MVQVLHGVGWVGPVTLVPPGGLCVSVPIQEHHEARQYQDGEQLMVHMGIFSVLHMFRDRVLLLL